MSSRLILYILICLPSVCICLGFAPQTLVQSSFGTDQSFISEKGSSIESPIEKQGDSKVADLVNRIEEELLDKKLSKNSLAELIEIVHQYSQNSHAHIILGNCCDSMGLPEQAMEQYKLAFKYGPNKIESFLELIKALVRSGQLTAASSLLKQAMQRFPADPQILFWTGNALYREHRYEDAAALYEEALAKSKKPIIGLRSSLASLYLGQDNYIKALELAMLDLACDKNLPQANEVVGLVFMRLGKYEKACPYLEVAFKNEPTSFSVSFAFARSLTWCGKYNDAFLPALFALANAGNPQERTSVQNTINMILPHLSKAVLKDNIDNLGRFRELEQNAYIHLQLAKICLDKNLLDLALTESFIAAKIDPHSAEAKYRLALILENYKHYYPAALQCLREAQVLEPYSHEISQHLMRLEDRLTINKSDWSWQLKDWLTNSFLSHPKSI